MKDFKDLSVMEKDIFGFFDDEEDEYYRRMDKLNNEYAEAIKKATKLAKEEGIWDNIVNNNDPENALIELQEAYPELFEEM